VARVGEQEIARALAWQPRLLDFDSTPLGEVVAEFNRRNVTQLVLADDALAGMPIVASVRSDNVEGFVRLLEVNGSVRVERRDGKIFLRAVR
jgi:transmembrane sensor